MDITILGIESSCDDTSAAVLRNNVLLSNVIASQAVHMKYGGVIPELASRAHQQNIIPVVDTALRDAGLTASDLDAIAFTRGPGLLGSLLVGVSFTKGLSIARNIPMVEVNHLQGHILSHFIDLPDRQLPHPDFPFLCLLVSGGHTQIVRVDSPLEMQIIGTTIDDAAGEAFDKAARAMGFPYPGGVHIDRAAKQGDAKLYKLPRPATKNPYDFSFSGLKTAVINLIHNNEQKGIKTDVNSLAACFQDTITSILAEKFMAAANELGYTKLALAGGVAANSMLRDKLSEMANASGKQFYMPDISLCGDNAAMVGAQGYYEFKDGNIADLTLNGLPTLAIDYR